jgi:hypothetical protein
MEQEQKRITYRQLKNGIASLSKLCAQEADKEIDRKRRWEDRQNAEDDKYWNTIGAEIVAAAAEGNHK